MRNLIIFGAGDIAELAAFYFTQDAGRRIACFTVDATHLTSSSFLGRPVVPFCELKDKFPASDFDAFVAMSYAGLNRPRSEKVKVLSDLGYDLMSYVSSKSTKFSDFACGRNCLILENNVIQPFVRIGSNVTLWSGNHIGHHSTIEDDVFISSHVVVSGGVSIKQGCFIGVNATIRDHVTIGRECVVGSSALVLEDQPDHSVIAERGTDRSAVPSTRLRRI